MKEITKEVKTKGKTVATIKIPQASTWAEAVKLAGGEEKALAKFNAQLVADAANKARRPAGGGIQKLVSKFMNDPKAAQADKDKLMELLKKYNIEV